MKVQPAPMDYSWGINPVGIEPNPALPGVNALVQIELYTPLGLTVIFLKPDDAKVVAQQFIKAATEAKAQGPSLQIVGALPPELQNGHRPEVG